jgi:hypothetical protein
MENNVVKKLDIKIYYLFKKDASGFFVNIEDGKVISGPFKSYTYCIKAVDEAIEIYMKENNASE